MPYLLPLHHKLHFLVNHPFSPFHSGFFPHQSTETTLEKVMWPPGCQILSSCLYCPLLDHSSLAHLLSNLYHHFLMLCLLLSFWCPLLLNILCSSLNIGSSQCLQSISLFHLPSLLLQSLAFNTISIPVTTKYVSAVLSSRLNSKLLNLQCLLYTHLDVQLVSQT